MTKFSTFLKIGSFVIPFFLVFIPLYSEIIFNPDIKIKVVPIQMENFTRANLIIQNTGLTPATNLRLTINPEYEIISYKTIFYTDEIAYEQKGTKSLIGKMERFANGQKIIIETLINSTDVTKYAIFATHDTGSTTYYYNKVQEQFNIVLLLAILAGIITSAAVGLSTNELIRRYEFKTQTADRGGVNLQDIANSNVTIQTGEPKPIKSEDTIGESKSDDQVRNLIKRIGTEKISNLLQEAKIIAIDTKDKEMQSWIELELVGFAPPPGKTLTRKEVKEKGLISDYRDIKGKFFVQIGDGSIHDMSYPVLFGNDIKSVENSIDTIKRGGRAYITHTFPKDTKLVGGQSGDLELPRSELERIITGAERKLSQYLESKLTKLS